MTIIADNLSQIQQEILQTAKKVNRDSKEIKLVAVSKTVSVEAIRSAVKVGVKSFGENKVQELLLKTPQLPPNVEWHMIGHLQTNKVKAIIDKISLIHSLDRVTLAQEISKRGQQVGRIVDLLVEVNIGGEATKQGLSPLETLDFIEEVAGYPSLNIKGLMTVAPFTENPEETRPIFRELRLLAHNIKIRNIPGVSMDLLSMGMSNDFKVAIEEGANIVRVGSRIFGERNYNL